MTSAQPATRIDEVAPDTYRISTPVEIPGGQFSFNQYLVVDDEPLLFHTGPRKLFPLVRAALERVLAARRLRYVGFSHFEADECGSLNEWLAAAPEAVPVCSKVAAMVSVDDVADRPARALGDGETIRLGKHTLAWRDTPHLPHAWECGYLMDRTTKVLFCGDLFTQPGDGRTPVTEGDILEPSEAFRKQMDYFSHGAGAPALIETLAAEGPRTLACMHGSTWRGDGAALLRELSRRLTS